MNESQELVSGTISEQRPKSAFDGVAFVFDKILDYASVLGMVCISFITVAVFVEIIVRNLFDNSLPWVTEYSQIGLCYMTFLGTAWLLRQEGHIKLELLSPKLGKKKAALLAVITSIMCAFTCLFVFWYGVQFTMMDIKSGANYGGEMLIPRWPVEIIIPLGFLALFFQLVRRTMKFYREYSKSQVVPQ
jgi:TRAP-type C4-dicarboxylate transport system permease small subunit